MPISSSDINGVIARGAEQDVRHMKERLARIEHWMATVTRLLIGLGLDAGRHADVEQMVRAYNEAVGAVWTIDP